MEMIWLVAGGEILLRFSTDGFAWFIASGRRMGRPEFCASEMLVRCCLKVEWRCGILLKSRVGADQSKY
jgi:hypothetical protein